VFVRESTVRRAAIDWLGAALLAAGPTTLMLCISQGATWGWDSAKTIGVLCGGVALIGAFVARERAAPEPLVALSRLTEPAIARANVAVFTVSIALFVAYVLVPLIAGYPSSTGYGLGLDTTQIGLLLLPGALANLVGGPIGGALLPRAGARVVATIGMVLAGGAYVVFLAFDYTEPVIALAMVLLGFAVGLVMSSIVCVVALSAQPGETGAMLGLNGVGRAIGASIGAQVAIAILTAGPQLAPNVPGASAYPRAFAFAGVATLVALMAVAALPRRGEGTVIGPAQAPA
jgi:predicted MFS family arabinose efflux permease